MIDPAEKSTEVPPPPTGRGGASAEVAPGVFLEGRLGLFHEQQKWLAVADLHFGYEIGRRAAGGLWPLWGMASVEERLRELIDARRPHTLVLVGDIVDGAAAPDEAVAWLDGLSRCCEKVVLVEGNHDRGTVRRNFDFVPWFETDGFFFHHGHRPELRERIPSGSVEISGHLHPSVSFHDGAGTNLRLPALVMETQAATSNEHWTLPAFSPWAGGCRYEPVCEGSFCREWACSPRRVFEVLA